jgi:molybdenum ABC transporter molybdate-binding protein
MHPLPSRPGRASTPWSLALVSLIVLAGLVAVLWLDLPSWFSGRRSSGKVVVFCAAGLKPAIAPLAEEYQRRTGVEVQLQYGGSNTLLSQIQAAPLADVFIPADDDYVLLAREKGLVREALPLASMKPVLIVPKGNPKKYADFADLLKRGGSVSQANPDAAAIGKVTRQVLTKAELWADWQKLVVVNKPTVNDVAIDVQARAADAGIVWNVTVKAVSDLDTIPIPPLEGIASTLSACVVSECKQPAEALRFARFLAARDESAKTFAEHGYEPANGDPWNDGKVPELRLRLGAMLRPALEPTLIAFEEREGVRITRSYNGCGILVSEMKAGEHTDAYFACDAEFMTMVADKFARPTTVSSNQLVILVHKGNPHGIKSLHDLGKPGLRVGIGHEKQCAMGVITQRTLKADKSDDVVMKNVKVQSPTGDMLVNQLLTNSLDAVVAYITNAAGHADKLEAVPIDIPCAFANQPFAVGKDSLYPLLMVRLRDAILSADSKERFEDTGFTWKGSK